jgi:outer membrane protein TolC
MNMQRIVGMLALFLGLSAAAQGPLTLTLQQAMDMAATQGFAVRSSTLEAEKAEARIKEVTAMGLPQVDATGGFNNYLTVPKSVIPNFTGSGPEFLEVQFGVPYTTTGALQLNQLIFDGSYLVGLRASRELRTRSEQDLEKTRQRSPTWGCWPRGRVRAWRPRACPSWRRALRRPPP